MVALILGNSFPGFQHDRQTSMEKKNKKQRIWSN